MLLQLLLRLGILPLAEPRLQVPLLRLVHDILPGTINDNADHHLIKVGTQLFGSFLYLVFVLGEHASPQFRVAQSCFFAQVCVYAVIEEDNLNVILAINLGLSYEDIARVRITVNEAFLVDHVVECLRYQSGTSLQVNTLSMHFFHA